MSDNNQLVSRNPSIEETSKNIRLIVDAISHGCSSIIEIQKNLESKNIKWDYNKVKRYYKAALELTSKEATMKESVDQRQILLSRAEAVASSEWATIEYLLGTRAEGIKRLKEGAIYDSLPFEQKEVLALPIDKFFGVVSKCKQVVLQSIGSQSELHGFKQDKTILVQHQKSGQLKYMDSLNKNLREKFRNNFDVNQEGYEAEIDSNTDINSEENQEIDITFFESGILDELILEEELVEEHTDE